MSEQQDKFRHCWEKTEVIRRYRPMLYTFGDTELPYMFVAGHSSLKDRTIVRHGAVIIQKPHILLPGSYGPEFAEGFDTEIPEEAAFVMRSMRLPFSSITHRAVSNEQVEYAQPDEVLERLDSRLEADKDDQTGLLWGLAEGMVVSLMRYSLGLMVKSAPGNVEHFFEHLRRQQGKPIQPNERVTDEDIRKLFG